MPVHYAQALTQAIEKYPGAGGEHRVDPCRPVQAQRRGAMRTEHKNKKALHQGGQTARVSRA